MYITLTPEGSLPLEPGNVTVEFTSESPLGETVISMKIMKSGRVECEPEKWVAVVRDNEIIGLQLEEDDLDRVPLPSAI